jgi:DNA replication protein DnaD
MSQGYIKLHRQIRDCWIWAEDEPYDRRSAWVDILLSANHGDNKMLFDGSLILIERGQFITSIRTLASRWKWSRTKVVHFLELLECDNMIKKESDTKKTLITIINYGVYQDSITEKKTAKSQSSDTEKPQKSLNNNDKECKKNVNNNKAFKKPTVEEIKAYCLERHNNVDADKFYNYYESNGWMVGRNKMKDWKASVRTWERNNYDKPKTKNDDLLDMIDPLARLNQ